MDEYDQKPKEEEDDVSELKFTKEFQNERTLIHAEVAKLLETRKKQNEDAETTGEGNEVELRDVFLRVGT